MPGSTFRGCPRVAGVACCGSAWLRPHLRPIRRHNWLAAPIPSRSDRIVPKNTRSPKAPRVEPVPEVVTAFHPNDGVVAEAPGVLQPSRIAFADSERGLTLYQGDCVAVMDTLAAKHPNGCFDLIFADPPYFLSNGGITCHGGKMVKVDKGAWDKTRGAEENHNFNREWLRRCQALLKPNGTLFVSGTHHVIFSVGFAMQQLGMKVLNQITWQKPNPPPNLACRYFTHSTETVLWAGKNAKSRHVFNYADMRRTNGGKQMKDVWKFAAPRREEKRSGRHPTQKPLILLERIILAASNPGDLVMDPFLGSGTTVIAAALLKRRCVGIESDAKHVDLAASRIREALQPRLVQGELEVTPPTAAGASEATRDAGGLLLGAMGDR